MEAQFGTLRHYHKITRLARDVKVIKRKTVMDSEYNNYSIE
jgi:hypothetical protein